MIDTPDSADPVIMRQEGQRRSNQPRKLAMYCAQKDGDFTQREIACYFNLIHTGSVSSAVRSIGLCLEHGSLKRENRL